MRNNKTSIFFGVVIGILIAGLFLYAIYRFLPLGVALAITGGALATLRFIAGRDRSIRIIGMLGSWLYPFGIIYAFIYNGWKWGLASIIFGFLAYRYAKPNPNEAKVETSKEDANLKERIKQFNQRQKDKNPELYKTLEDTEDSIQVIFRPQMPKRKTQIDTRGDKNNKTNKR